LRTARRSPTRSRADAADVEEAVCVLRELRFSGARIADVLG
jgi:hypothetical protein